MSEALLRKCSVRRKSRNREYDVGADDSSGNLGGVVVSDPLMGSSGGKRGDPEEYPRG